MNEHFPDGPLSNFALLSHIEKVVDSAIKTHELEKTPELANFRRDISDILKKLTELEALIKSGFPNGDPLTHCRVHESYIKEAQDRQELATRAKHRIWDMGVGGVVIVLGTALWDYIRNHLK